MIPTKKKSSPTKRKSNFGPYTTFDNAFEQSKKMMKGFDEVKDSIHYISKRIHTELNEIEDVMENIQD